MVSESNIFVLSPFNTSMEEKNTKRKAELKTLMTVLLPKKNNPKEPIVAEAPPTLKLLIDNLDIDNKEDLHLGNNLHCRNRIELLLKLMEANLHVQLKNSTKILQIGQEFSGSSQLSTKVNLVTILKDLQQTSKTI